MFAQALEASRPSNRPYSAFDAFIRNAEAASRQQPRGSRGRQRIAYLKPPGERRSN